MRASAYFSGHGLSFWDTAGPEVILAEVGCTLTADDGTCLAYPLSAKEWKHQGGVVARLASTIRALSMVLHLPSTKSTPDCSRSTSSVLVRDAEATFSLETIPLAPGFFLTGCLELLQEESES